MDGNRKASVEIVRKRVNSKSIVYILESLYDLCGVSGYFFEEVNTSKKRLDGYVKHICQTQQANANDFRIKEMQVLQA